MIAVTEIAPLRPASPPVRELTYPISTDYVSSWTAARAIAELISNAIDADPAGFTVGYAEGILTIEDTCSIGVGAEGMVLGFSDKRGRNDMIGQFGEGLKLGTLVLARDSRIDEVFVETVGYAFVPQVTSHALLGDMVIPTRGTSAPQVLAWQLWPSARTAGTRVQVRCPERIAREAMARFRQISQPGYRRSESSEVLLDEPGRIYIGGVLVSQVKDLVFGYDFALGEAKSLQNRDRTVLDANFLNPLISATLGEGLARREVAERLLEALLADEVGIYEAASATKISRAATRAVVHAVGEARLGAEPVFYAAAYQEELLPDLTDRSYRRLTADKAGYHANGLFELFGVPSATTLVKRPTPKRREERTTFIARTKLTTAERNVLEVAEREVRGALGPNALAKVKVYETISLYGTDQCVSFAGFYEPGSGDVAVARSQLASLGDTRDTLVHEAAHRLGARFPRELGLPHSNEWSDRTRGFEQVLGRIASRLLAQAAGAGLPAVAGPVPEAAAPDAVPGLTYEQRGNYWEQKMTTAVAFSALLDGRLREWAVAHGVPVRSAVPRYARAHFLKVSLVHKLLAGRRIGSDLASLAEVLAPLGLDAGAAWWLTTGAYNTAYHGGLTSRAGRGDHRRFYGSVRTAASGATASLRGRGTAWAELAATFEDYAEGRAFVSRDQADWTAPFERLLELERTASEAWFSRAA